VGLDWTLLRSSLVLVISWKMWHRCRGTCTVESVCSEWLWCAVWCCLYGGVVCWRAGRICVVDCATWVTCHWRVSLSWLNWTFVLPSSHLTSSTHSKVWLDAPHSLLLGVNHQWLNKTDSLYDHETHRILSYACQIVKVSASACMSVELAVKLLNYGCV